MYIMVPRVYFLSLADGGTTGHAHRPIMAACPFTPTAKTTPSLAGDLARPIMVHVRVCFGKVVRVIVEILGKKCRIRIR